MAFKAAGNDCGDSEMVEVVDSSGSINEGDTLVMVGHDGVSLPPITFPPSSQPGGHLLAFLSCLENALMPQAQLEPPLWLHRTKGKVHHPLLLPVTLTRFVMLPNAFPCSVLCTAFSFCSSLKK